MDVTCERCGTEYEFDETLVSDRGTTVKCTHCGHLFKVFRPGSDPAGGPETGTWVVEHDDGTTESLASLRELQQRITRGELTEEDRISRSGESWKRLGDIAELQTFFHAARAAQQPPRPPPAEAEAATQQGGPFAPSPSTHPAAPDSDERAFAPTMEGPLPGKAGAQGGGRSPKGTVLGMGAPEPAAPANSPPPSPPPASAPPASAPEATTGRGGQATPWAEGPGTDDEADTVREPPPPRSRQETAPAGSGTGADDVDATARPGAPRPPAARPAAAQPTPGPAPPRRAPSERPPMYVDEDDRVPGVPRKGGRTGVWVAVLLLLGAGVAVALNWNKLAPMVGLAPAEDPLQKFLDRGDEQLANDHIDAYDEAESEYTKASALDERDPRVLSRLARVHALWAQALDFDARDLEARAKDDPTLEGEAAGLRRSQERHADEAREHAEDAVRRDPGSAEAELALADAMRLTGDPAGAEDHLQRARDMMGDSSADAQYVGALLAMDQADDDVAAAEPDAREAVETDGELVRARLLLARALLAKGDVSDAKTHIRAVMGIVAGHPRAESLQQAIDQGIPPASPVLEVPDGGTADAGAARDAGAPLQAEATEDDDEPVAAVSGGGGGGGGGGGRVPSGRDYNFYVRKGEELQQRGDVGRAREYFEEALGKRPNGAEALSGLGFLALDKGSHGEALRHFQKASGQGYAEAYIGLGMTYKRTGKLRQALEAYRSYLERSPSGPSATIAQNQVRNLEDEVGSGSGGGDDAPDEPEDSGDAPTTPPDEMPAPEDTEPGEPVPQEDPPAPESEP